MLILVYEDINMNMHIDSHMCTDTVSTFAPLGPILRYLKLASCLVFLDTFVMNNSVNLKEIHFVSCDSFTIKAAQCFAS